MVRYLPEGLHRVVFSFPLVSELSPHSQPLLLLLWGPYVSCCVNDLTSTTYDENLAWSPSAWAVVPRASDLEKSYGGTTRVGLRWSSRSLCARPRPARPVAQTMLVELAFEIANGIVAARSE